MGSAGSSAKRIPLKSRSPEVSVFKDISPPLKSRSPEITVLKEISPEVQALKDRSPNML